jgi:hypothetical protein
LLVAIAYDDAFGAVSWSAIRTSDEPIRRINLGVLQGSPLLLAAEARAFVRGAWRLPRTLRPS